MAYFDHKVNLPKIFTDNELSILPSARGKYIISNFDAYQALSYKEDVWSKSFNFPSNIKSIDTTNIYSESIALNAAYLSGIIDDFIGEKTTHTLSGRMSTSSFDFNIRNIRTKKSFPVTVENCICEIDGGFESENCLVLIEAKNFIVDDFLIRQLYYPYRLWKSKIKKRVVPVFMTFSNDTFSFFKYNFSDVNEYNSLVLLEQKDYCYDEKITGDDIYRVLKETEIKQEFQVPFPQADTFKKIIDLGGLLMVSDLSKDEITSNFNFDKRQTDYYSNAGIYLRLIKKEKTEKEIMYSLTDSGKSIMSKSYKEKYLLIVSRIIEHEVFNKTLLEYFITREIPVITRVSQIMKKCKIYNVGTDETYKRRAQTVIRWIEWILGLTEIN